MQWVDKQSGIIAVLSAGDDQAIVVTTLRIKFGSYISNSSIRESPLQIMLLGRSETANAHSSSIKALSCLQMAVPEQPSFSADGLSLASSSHDPSSGVTRPSLLLSLVVTTGLDQRVRLWSLRVQSLSMGELSDEGSELKRDRVTEAGSAKVTLEEQGSAITEVMEPSAVSILELEGSPGGSRGIVVAVAGRGVQTLTISKLSDI